MKVWLLRLGGDDEGPGQVEGVFSSEEKAQKWLKYLIDDYEQTEKGASVYPWEVDEYGAP